MSNLVYEIVLRLAQGRRVALVLGLVLYAGPRPGPSGDPGSAELALLCWLSGAAFILLVETSPI